MKIDVFAVGSVNLTARIYPLAKMLRSSGVVCDVEPPINWDQIAKGKTGKILSSLFSHSLRKCLQIVKNSPDVLMIGKVSTLQIYLLQNILKRKKVKILFDLIDATFLPTGSLFGINIRPGSFFLEKVILKSDFITVNGHYLLNYVQLFNKNAAIIHDPVDTKLFHPTLRNNQDKITIGWEGVPQHHYNNLCLLINPLMKLSKKYDIRLKLISYLGDLKVKEMFSELEQLIEVDYGLTQWAPMSEFPELLSDIDIMVAPLQRTPWYEGKSALRVGISMAMGIPIVASPVGEQKYIIKHGVNGLLARDQEEWHKHIQILIKDEGLRKKLGRKGRETAEKELSMEVCGKKLFNILTNII